MDAGRRATLLRHLGFIAALGLADSSAYTACPIAECPKGNLGDTTLFVLANAAGHTLVVGTMWALVVAGERLTARTRPLAWIKGLATTMMAGLASTLVGFQVAPLIAKTAPAWQVNWFQPENFGAMLFWHCVLAGMLYAWWSFDRRSRRTVAAAADAELMRSAAERSWDETHYRLLQAQIEPHFIFNSLANVRRLLRTDAAAADRLLDDLLRYFEHALPRLREERSTLGREMELVHAFLAVHQVRMGRRLRMHIDLPPELASLEVPPMLLLTLVENALKHGLQPLVEGGEVRVAAARANPGRLLLTVADTGAGMGSGQGGGSGLANTRARLRSLYGDAGRLSLRVNEPRGVVAAIDLPIEACT